MLEPQQMRDLTNFLNRLQKQIVRVEYTSRLNAGFRFSYECMVLASAKSYSFITEDGSVTVFINPDEAEGFTSDHESISLVYGDQIVSIRKGRNR